MCYYEAAVERMKEAWKNAEKISSDKTAAFKDVNTFTNDVLTGKSVTSLRSPLPPSSLSLISSRFKSAKRDNDCVYFEKVPTLASLPAIQGQHATTENNLTLIIIIIIVLSSFTGAIVAKPQLFDSHDPDVSGTDIFHKLVPMVISATVELGHNLPSRMLIWPRQNTAKKKRNSCAKSST